LLLLFLCGVGEREDVNCFDGKNRESEHTIR
jgi:hypothetical protein